GATGFAKAIAGIETRGTDQFKRPFFSRQPSPDGLRDDATAGASVGFMRVAHQRGFEICLCRRCASRRGALRVAGAFDRGLAAAHAQSLPPAARLLSIGVDLSVFSLAGIGAVPLVGADAL